MRSISRIFMVLSVVCVSCPAWASDNEYNIKDLLAPAPVQRTGSDDYFGKQMNPGQAYQFVASKDLNPQLPESYLRLGLVKITDQLMQRGENIFNNRGIGDNFGTNRVVGVSTGFAKIAPDVFAALAALNGQATTNLKITLSQDMTIGSVTVPQGVVRSPLAFSRMEHSPARCVMPPWT